MTIKAIIVSGKRTPSHKANIKSTSYIYYFIAICSSRNCRTVNCDGPIVIIVAPSTNYRDMIPCVGSHTVGANYLNSYTAGAIVNPENHIGTRTTKKAPIIALTTSINILTAKSLIACTRKPHPEVYGESTSAHIPIGVIGKSNTV